MTTTTRPKITERQLQDAVVELAQTLGWLTYHPFDSRHSTAGFPDLAMVRDRLIMAELKSDKGRVSRDQLTWNARLLAADVEAYIWRPRDWTNGNIERVLRYRKP